METEKKRLKILAVGAHPDDVEFGCAGTLKKFQNAGHEVYLLVMTQGEQGGSPELRKQEQEASGEILGIRQIFWGGYPDTYIPVDKQVIDRIEDVLATVHPDYVFCHYPDDTHQDHRHLAQATISASRGIQNVLFFEVPTTQNFSPNVFVDISDTLDDKDRALEAHGSQITKTNIENRSILTLAQASARFRGLQGRIQNAEAFCVSRMFITIPDIKEPE